VLLARNEFRFNCVQEAGAEMVAGAGEVPTPTDAVPSSAPTHQPQQMTVTMVTTILQIAVAVGGAVISVCGIPDADKTLERNVGKLLPCFFMNERAAFLNEGIL
jgi:hypothetical protein